MSQHLKVLCEMEKLASKPLRKWTAYSTTCVKFVKECSGSTIEYYYQAQKVKRYVTADEYFVAHYKHTKGVSQCIKSHLEWSDLERYHCCFEHSRLGETSGGSNP